MDRKRKSRLQKLYAAWGTTREKHLSLMMDLVDRLNAKVDNEMAAASESTASEARPAKRRAAALKPAAAKGKTGFATNASITNRLRGTANAYAKQRVAWIAAKLKTDSPDITETETHSLNPKCLADGLPMRMNAGAATHSGLQHGKKKSLHSQGYKSGKGRRKR